MHRASTDHNCTCEVGVMVMVVGHWRMVAVVVVVANDTVGSGGSG
jgi:hypothetical protein